MSEPELARRLSLFDLTMIAIGSSIGSGIFVTPSHIAADLPSPLGILAVWAAGGAMTLAGALTFAELGVVLPRAGGVYLYLTEAYGKLTGFLYGWAYFTVVTTGAIAALAVAFASYVAYLVPLGPHGQQAVAIGAIVLVTAVNVSGVKAGALFSDVFTVLKLAAIAGIVTLGVVAGSGATSDYATPIASAPKGIGSAAGAAMVGVLWSYGGWQHASFGAAEARRPARDVPLAMVLGTLAVTLVYVVANVAYMRLLSPADMARSPEVAASAVGVVLGRAGGAAIAVAIMVSTLGTLGIYTLTAPRMYMAMAERGLFFRGAAAIHPRFRTPARAIALQSAWACAIVLAWGTFNEIISYVVFVDWIFFALTAGAVFVLRRRHPDWPRPYRTLGYPVTPLAFIGLATWFVASTLVERPTQAAAGAALLVLGAAAFAVWRAKA